MRVIVATVKMSKVIFAVRRSEDSSGVEGKRSLATERKLAGSWASRI